GVVPRGHGPNAEGSAEGNPVAAVEEPGEPGRGAGRACAVGGGPADESALGDGVLPEGGLAADLATSRQGDGSAVSGGLAAACRGVLHQGTTEVRGDASDVPDRHPGVLRLPDLDGTVFCPSRNRSLPSRELAAILPRRNTHDPATPPL